MNQQPDLWGCVSLCFQSHPWSWIAD